MCGVINSCYALHAKQKGQQLSKGRCDTWVMMQLPMCMTEVFCIHLGHDGLQSNQGVGINTIMTVLLLFSPINSTFNSHIIVMIIIIGVFPPHHPNCHAGGDILEGMPPGQVKAARHMLQDLHVSIVTNAMVSPMQTDTIHGCCHKVSRTRLE